MPKIWRIHVLKSPDATFSIEGFNQVGILNEKWFLVKLSLAKKCRMRNYHSNWHKSQSGNSCVKFRVTWLILDHNLRFYEIRTVTDFRLNFFPFLPPPTKLRECNVFSCVCLSVHSGSPCGDYPWCIGNHCTGIPPDLHVQTCLTWTSLYRDPTSQTCSNLFIMKHIRLASGRWTSYWNAFLFEYLFSDGSVYQNKQ